MGGEVCPCFSKETLDLVLSRIEGGTLKLKDYNCNSTEGALKFTYTNSMLPEFVDFGNVHAFGIYDESCLQDDTLRPTTISESSTCLSLMKEVCEDIVEMETEIETVDDISLDDDCPCYSESSIKSMLTNIASGKWNVKSYDCEYTSNVKTVSYEINDMAPIGTMRIPLPHVTPFHTIGLNTFAGEGVWCIEDDMRMSTNEVQASTCMELILDVCSEIMKMETEIETVDDITLDDDCPCYSESSIKSMLTNIASGKW